MADKFHLGDWTKQSVAIGGTGVLTLGPSPGYPTLAESVGVDNRVVYTILNSNLSPLEIGYGRLINANTFEREVVRKTFFDGTYSTGESLPPVNVPAGCVFYTGPTEDLLEYLTLEKMLLDFGNVSGAFTVSLRASALRMNLTANTTLTFTELPPPGVKYELTLHASSNNAGTADIGKGFMLTLPNTCYLGKNVCPAIPLLHDIETVLTLTTVDGGASWQVLWHNGHANIRDLGNVTGTINLDIRYQQTKGVMGAGSSSTLTIAGVDPAAKLGEPAHFVIKNDSGAIRYVEFDPDIFTTIGSILVQVAVPLGYKLDFTVRKNPMANDADPAYDVWINGINYDISASGLATLWNPSDKATQISLTSDNKTASMPPVAGIIALVRAFGGKTTGKHMFALRCDQAVIALATSNSPQTGIGVATLDLALNGVQLGATATSYAAYFRPRTSGQIIGTMNNNVVTSGAANLTYPALGEIWRVLVDLDDNKIWFAKNALIIGGGNPEAGTGQTYNLAPDAVFFPAVSMAYFNSGQPGIWTLLNEIEDPYLLAFPSFQYWTA